MAYNPENLAATVMYQGVTRYIWKNPNDAHRVKGIYEPIFLASFNAAESFERQELCVDVVMDAPEYQAAVRAAAAQNGLSGAMLRLPLLDVVLQLTSRVEGASYPGYTWSPPVKLANSDVPSVTACFRIPGSLTRAKLARAARDASVSFHYVLNSEQYRSASCSLMIEVANTASLLHALSGPAGAQGGHEVYVTRNQFVDLVRSGRFTITRACRTRAGERKDLVSLRELEKYMPALLSEVRFVHEKWDRAIARLADYSFPGHDAKTQLTAYMTQLSTKAKDEKYRSQNIEASGKAQLLDLASAKATTKHGDVAHDRIRREYDFTYWWDGQKIIPATLNVAVLRSANGTHTAQIVVRDGETLGTVLLGRTVLTPIQVPTTVTAECSEVPRVELFSECEQFGPGGHNRFREIADGWFGEAHLGRAWCQHDTPGSGHAQTLSACTVADGRVQISFSNVAVARGGYTKSDDCTAPGKSSQSCWTRSTYTVSRGGAELMVPPEAAGLYVLHVVRLNCDSQEELVASGFDLVRIGSKDVKPLRYDDRIALSPGRYVVRARGSGSAYQVSPDADPGEARGECQGTFLVEPL
ncbi:MAG: hypothetical protein A2V77_06215 [Anaeromyxobacter sp. RBG_16_69_14]|nr:MAG: hypothetical protein A2V77_06215 [Anaeromyxobacter sp. RBG_16_69_14]